MNIKSAPIEGNKIKEDVKYGGKYNEVGFIEDIEIKGIGKLKAKFDTGSEVYSALHAENIKQSNGMVEFDINGKHLKKKIIRKQKVDVGSKNIEDRVVVEFPMKLGKKTYPSVRFSLANRSANETEVLMPAPIYYSHKILELMAADRKNGKADKLEPDSKSQITMMYENEKPTKVTSVVISTQHAPEVNQSQVKEIVRPYLEKSIPKELLLGLKEEEFYVNPTGRFIIGGPDGDAGLTGRKIIVDTYGGAAPHGGGAFSGKDPSKVDRSAAYVARYLAKNIVASKIANKCLIQLAYAIGVSKPLSIYVNLFDNDDEKSKHVEKIIKDNFDLSPRGIREMLSLNKPIYECTAAYGHFGRNPGINGSFSWEKTDNIAVFKK